MQNSLVVSTHRSFDPPMEGFFTFSAGVGSSWNPKVRGKNKEKLQPPPPPPRKTPAPRKKQNLRDKLAAQQQDTIVLVFFEVVRKKALHNCHKADKVIGLWRCSFIVHLYCKFQNKLPIVNQSFARNSSFVWMARQPLSVRVALHIAVLVQAWCRSKHLCQLVKKDMISSNISTCFVYKQISSSVSEKTAIICKKKHHVFIALRAMKRAS